ncbi:MAG: hypothetical protein QM805_23300 [Pseudomonas sp.]
MKQNVGSDNLFRTFARVNTGEVNGFSAWLSASRTTADLWDNSGGNCPPTAMKATCNTSGTATASTAFSPAS